MDSILGSSLFRGSTAVMRTISKDLNKGYYVKYSLLLAVFLRNRLDPNYLADCYFGRLKNGNKTNLIVGGNKNSEWRGG